MRWFFSNEKPNEMESKVENVDGTIILKKGTHYSRSGLAAFLNEEYGGKKNGTKFNSRDIQQYAIRGELPEQYGGHSLSELKHPDMGVFVMVTKKDQ